MPGLRSGVGIDLEDLAILDGFDEKTVARTASRLLSPGEQSWCAIQPTMRHGLTIVWCCREAAFKACRDAGTVMDLPVQMTGDSRVGEGSAQAMLGGPILIRVMWRLMGGRVLAVAASGSSGFAETIGARLTKTLDALHYREAAWRS